MATVGTLRRLPGARVLGSLEVRDTSPPTRETHHMPLEEWGYFPFRTGSGHKKKGAPSLRSSAVKWKPANALTSEGRTESTPPQTGLPLIQSGGQEVRRLSQEEGAKLPLRVVLGISLCLSGSVC